MDVAGWALIVSGLSMATSVGSLAWNMTSFRRSGPLVRVEAKLHLEGRPYPHDGDDGIQDWQVANLPGSRHLNCIIVRVEVVNKGRLAIGINKVDLKLETWPDNGFTFYAAGLDDYGNHRLEAFATREYVFDISSWQRILEPSSGFNSGSQIESVVYLGNGTIVRAPNISVNEFHKKHEGAVAFKEAVARRASANSDENS